MAHRNPTLDGLVELLASALVVSALAGAGCAGTDASGRDGPARSFTLSSGAPSALLDDAQIADILRASFTASLEEAHAGALSPDPEVVSFAKLMSTEYRRALDEEQSVLGARHLAPEPTGESLRITSGSKAAVRTLAMAQGLDLERAFLARESTAQQKLLNVIDDEVLPSVRDAELRQEALRVRPAVARMLADASRLETWLLTQP